MTTIKLLVALYCVLVNGDDGDFSQKIITSEANRSNGKSSDDNDFEVEPPLLDIDGDLIYQISFFLGAVILFVVLYVWIHICASRNRRQQQLNAISNANSNVRSSTGSPPPPYDQFAPPPYEIVVDLKSTNKNEMDQIQQFERPGRI